jgi:hypothetical protein
MPRAAVCIALAALAAASACKEKKKADSEARSTPEARADKASASPTPATVPDLPDPVSLDCARIVPDAVRAAHFPGFAVQPTIQGPIATCMFSHPDGKLRPSVSLFCHPRKRNWNFVDEVARDPHKKAIEGLGRGAYARADHVFFYPSKLDCLGRVIWPADAEKAAAVAKALDPHLTKSTVSAAPTR